MLQSLDHPLIKRDITILRDKATNSRDFRAAMTRIGIVLATEASKHVRLSATLVTTPLETTEGFRLAHEVVLLPVLRAGTGLVEPFLDVIPDARIGYIGLRRNEETLQTEEYYYNVPLSPDALVFVLDPMLATGGSICSTIRRIQQAGVKHIVVVSVIAAPEGIARVAQEFPSVPVIVATLDRCLNDVGYILPGLGDAGDRYHGT